MSNRHRICFHIGELCATAHVLAAVSSVDIAEAVSRHRRGDWGDLSKPDKQANNDALKNGTRLLSTYKARNGTVFWIITEADRSATTIMLPKEY